MLRRRGNISRSKLPSCDEAIELDGFVVPSRAALEAVSPTAQISGALG